MTQTESESRLRDWGQAPTSRVPGWVYTDPAVFQKELERFFYHGHWCYVGLVCEIPEPGSFKRTVVGGRSVIPVRDQGSTASPSCCEWQFVGARSSRPSIQTWNHLKVLSDPTCCATSTASSAIGPCNCWDSMSEILSVGRYLDRIVDTGHGLRFAERLCIFDNDLIANSLIYPI